VSVRIGQGVDVHAFSDDPHRRLVLGGVEIPDAPGLVGHSDADVVLHAIVDALLGAIAAGDIGTLVGVDDPRHAGAASAGFVMAAMDRVRAAGWQPVNVDCTIVAARPRLAPHREAMRGTTARLLQLPEAAVSLKATTSDGLGFTGRGEGIAALAVCLLEPLG
jgi:2-C-methyl-D-erythritol 2,4-cyclodiphosphate synthase